MYNRYSRENPVGSLPYVTESIPGVGGRIKESPDDFKVTEIPLYEPGGEGEHIYIRVHEHTRGTESLKKDLVELFDLPDHAVGFAGRKDKNARTTQYFSLHMHDADVEETKKKIEEKTGIQINLAERHQNKLRTGHLIGNAFRIRIRQMEVPMERADERTRNILKTLREKGVPNYYGPQRFGGNQDGAVKGQSLVMGADLSLPHWKKQLLISAFQSSLFHQWLLYRMENNLFRSLLQGDIAKKRDTGGLFVVEEPEVEQDRFEAKEIVYTGPIYGYDMWKASAEAGEIEKRILDDEDLSPPDFEPVGAPGSRRRSLFYPADVHVDRESSSLSVEMSLPKGCYATTVLREIMKTDLDRMRA